MERRSRRWRAPRLGAWQVQRRQYARFFGVAKLFSARFSRKTSQQTPQLPLSQLHETAPRCATAARNRRFWPYFPGIFAIRCSPSDNSEAACIRITVSDLRNLAAWHTEQPGNSRSRKWLAPLCLEYAARRRTMLAGPDFRSWRRGCFTASRPLKRSVKIHASRLRRTRATRSSSFDLFRQQLPCEENHHA